MIFEVAARTVRKVAYPLGEYEHVTIHRRPNCNFSQTGDRFPEVTDLGRRSSAQGAHFSKLR